MRCHTSDLLQGEGSEGGLSAGYVLCHVTKRQHNMYTSKKLAYLWFGGDKPIGTHWLTERQIYTRTGMHRFGFTH